jgi:hypothetical protein
MKEYGGMELQHHSFLSLALGAVKLSASCPGQFTIKKKAPRTHSTRDMIGLTPGPDAFMKINGFWTCQELKHDS